MILVSHPTGSQFVRETLAAFDQAGLLAEFWTTINWNDRAALNSLLPAQIRDLLARRSFPSSIRSRTRTVPAREIGRLLATQFGFSPRHEHGMLSIDAVMSDLDAKVSRRLRAVKNCNVVYSYEDGALETFRAARELGIRRAYDLPIGYWRVAQKIFAEEAEREPEWAGTLTGTRDSAEKLERKDQELALADRVIVASTFTKETLDAAPVRAKIDIVPYGAPASSSSEIRKPSERLKVLFAGALGQRKGLSYLLKAVELLNDSVDLTLLGQKTVNDCAALNEAVRKHRWIRSLPHAGMLREMAEHDVLVFPSLFEGFGLVVLEAMAQGTPVITTAHTCGPDVLTDGVDGFIVPIRSAEAIADKLDLLNRDRDRLMEIKRAAKAKAALHGWEDYRRRLVAVARELMAQ
ncbi:MAG TPA: glycosyltransferase family 4 protein [Chthoniobacterales bacterium]|jgi:glycosyltransferase involved in cell wall biosynthesis|nr:glycosyltransferase family 4 protein [Chthoniobacterales bacterium]